MSRYIARIAVPCTCFCSLCIGQEPGEPHNYGSIFRFQILEAECLEQARITGPNRIELDYGNGEDLVSVEEYTGPLPAGSHGYGDV